MNHEKGEFAGNSLFRLEAVVYTNSLKMYSYISFGKIWNKWTGVLLIETSSLSINLKRNNYYGGTASEIVLDGVWHKWSLRHCRDCR